MITNTQLIDGYVQMVSERVAAGWSPYLLTFMYEQIGGPRRRVNDVMQKEVERVYATKLTRIVRSPRSAWHAWKCPIFVGGPDWPVPKHDRTDKQWILPNDGQHVHGVELMPPTSRLKEPLDDHLHDEQPRYVRKPLLRIDAVRVTHDAGYVTEYVLKGLQRSATADDIIILPRSRSELYDR